MSILAHTHHFKDQKWLLLPVETKGRELDGKTLLALEAAERGWSTILGRGLRHKPYLPKGLFFENSISPGRAPDIKANLAKGIKSVAWCEEGAVYLFAEEYGRRRVEAESYNLLENYFSWGPNQANDLTQKIGCDPKKLVLAGNPRFDLLRSDMRDILAYRAKNIRKKYGKIILVNTKFAMYSNYHGPDFFINKMKERGKLSTPGLEATQNANQSYQKETFFAFQEAVKSLSLAHPEHTIIVRPHPSESHDPWKEIAKTHKNIKVIFEGNVAEWILACDVCIHNNCTTGVEAYLLDRNNVSYRPYKDERFDAYLPHALSDEAETIKELLNWVSKALSEKDMISPEVQREREEIRDYYLAGQKGDTACHTILNTIQQLDVSNDDVQVTISKKEDVIRQIKGYLRPFKHKFYSAEKLAKVRYIEQKFNGVDLKEMQNFLLNAQKITGRFKDIEIVQLEPNIFCVRKNP